MNSLDVVIQHFSGSSIATIGTDNVFVSFKMRRLGETFELVADSTVYYAASGHYEYEELACGIADDEDEAISIATDLEWDAQGKLKILDVENYSKEPGGFPESLEKFLDAMRRVVAPAAAE